MKKVSVIITTYKRDFKLLERAILSVLNQSYQNIECIVVDDNLRQSRYSNEIKKGISKYNNVKYLTYEENKGACFARNFGARYAIGEYFAFLDDDDEWDKEKIFKQVVSIEENKCDMVTCDATYIKIDKEGNEVKRFSVIKTEDIIISLEKLLKKNIIGGCSFPLITKEIFTKCGGFTTDLPSAQDYDLWIKIASIGKVYRVNQCLVKYYVHAGDRITGNIANKIKAYEYLIKEYSHLSSNKNIYIAGKYSTLAEVCFISNRLSLGIKYAIKAFRNDKNPNIYFYIKLLMFGVYKRITPN